MPSNVLLDMPIRDTYRVVHAPDVVRDIAECLTITGDLHTKHTVRLGKDGDEYELLGDGAVYEALKAHPDIIVNVLVHVLELSSKQAAVAHSANVLIGGERRPFYPVERLEVAVSVYKAFPEKEALKVLNGTHPMYTHKLMDNNRAGEAIKVLKLVGRRDNWTFFHSVLDVAREEISVIIRSNPNATSPKVFSWQTLAETALWAASDTVQQAVLEVLKRRIHRTIKVTADQLKELIMREAVAEAEAASAVAARARSEALQAAAREEAEAAARARENEVAEAVAFGTGVEVAAGVVARSGAVGEAAAAPLSRDAADADAHAEAVEAAARAEEDEAMQAATITTHNTALQKAHDKKNATFVTIAESSAFRDAMAAKPPGEPDEDALFATCNVCLGWLHKPFFCTVCGYKMCLRCTLDTGVNGTGAASATKVACPQQCTVPFATKASIYGTMAGNRPYSVLTDMFEGFVKVKLELGKRKREEV